MITYEEILKVLNDNNLMPIELKRKTFNKTRTGYETITTGIIFHAPSICKDFFLKTASILFEGTLVKVDYDPNDEMLLIEIPEKEKV